MSLALHVAATICITSVLAQFVYGYLTCNCTVAKSCKENVDEHVLVN